MSEEKKETTGLEGLTRISGKLSKVIHPDGRAFVIFICDQFPGGGIAPWDLPEPQEETSAAPSRNPDQEV